MEVSSKTYPNNFKISLLISKSKSGKIYCLPIFISSEKNALQSSNTQLKAQVEELNKRLEDESPVEYFSVSFYLFLRVLEGVPLIMKILQNCGNSSKIIERK